MDEHLSGFDKKKAMMLFNEYKQHLLVWNEKVNLISRKSEAVEAHILNSIFFLTKYKLTGSEKLADIGTGGGFPGIPLKILYPDLHITLIDSIRKKINAVADIVEKMNLLECEAVSSRAEELGKKVNYKMRFDVVISKAVAPLSELYNYSVDLLKPGGRMLAIKGGDISQEIADLKNELPQMSYNLIEYSFPKEFNIEDKKLFILKK